MNSRRIALCTLIAVSLPALPVTGLAACDARSGSVLQALGAQHYAGS
jgi:hypothetical protein